MHTDPDYSAPYVTLKTSKEGLVGNGLTFTLGRGNEICLTAIQGHSEKVRKLQTFFFLLGKNIPREFSS